MPIGPLKARLGAEGNVFILCKECIETIENGHGKATGNGGHGGVLSVWLFMVRQILAVCLTEDAKTVSLPKAASYLCECSECASVSRQALPLKESNPPLLPLRRAAGSSVAWC